MIGEEIAGVDAFYPSFSIGQKTYAAMPCRISVVRVGGKMYVQTPFAFINAYSSPEDELARQLMPRQGGGYYKTEEECLEFLRYQYPHSELAYPIWDCLCRAIRRDGDIRGPSYTAEKYGLSIHNVYPMARGDKAYTRKQIKEALKYALSRTEAK